MDKYTFYIGSSKYLKEFYVCYVCVYVYSLVWVGPQTSNMNTRMYELGMSVYTHERKKTYLEAILASC